ncbi:hypothetical protein DU504_11785 [Haloplanus salinus]|jgi:hypothetical protein|uniref:Uncharacterized protein n=2 Tax=Haloplanus salinus TaxID=1126245 RepID=A0A368ND20_9EURY|nr:hypothetical protein DU504_11785 [Haloplanus salinus]
MTTTTTTDTAMSDGEKTRRQIFGNLLEAFEARKLEVALLNQFEDTVEPITPDDGAEYIDRGAVMLCNPENEHNARIHLYLNGRNTSAFKFLDAAAKTGFTVGDLFIRYFHEGTGTIQVRLDFPDLDDDAEVMI